MLLWIKVTVAFSLIILIRDHEFVTNWNPKEQYIYSPPKQELGFLCSFLFFNDHMYLLLDFILHFRQHWQQFILFRFLVADEHINHQYVHPDWRYLKIQWCWIASGCLVVQVKRALDFNSDWTHSQCFLLFILTLYLSSSLGPGWSVDL